ncbi:hypothetical protein ASG01_07635 [Chryseobacterium sp. Leaf180]|jgi:hypothetical protein|uniref:hypothetical protein n=1 Tax=Chryseobacterium sp. Leaf180 TaxID=1736289 RepID=UPI0006FB525F|nr:hypothetical protein [Chryseobacterium sp. Leaf180]KQR93730.1 hypothetical protein ASG01_07635 [Chryseobacterium sp. Leaf180]
MRKYFPIILLAFTSLFVYSCNNDRNDEVPVQQVVNSTAYDLSPNFTKVNSSLYSYGNTFNKPLENSDVVLIYIQTDTASNSPVWRLLPYTFFVNNANNDEVEYSFDFSKFDIAIYVNATLNLDANSSYYTGKRFRVVVVPANAGKGVAAPVDYNNYNEVIKFYGIDESKIKLRN